MAELEPGSNPIKGTASVGVEVSTTQRPSAPDAQIQEVASLDRYGNKLGTVIDKVNPVRVSILEGDTAPHLALAADETRTGFRLFWQDGGIVLIGYGDYDGDLDAFRENAIPWLATIPWIDDWKGPVYVATPDPADQNIYVQAK